MCVTQLVQIVVFLYLSTLGVLCFQEGAAKTKNTSGIRIIRPPRNQTVMMDRRLKLYCKTLPDSVRIRWFHNNELMPAKKDFYSIKSGGTVLRFTKVQVFNRGEYKCVVENEFKTKVESKPAILEVHTPAIIMNKQVLKRERRSPIGSTIFIECKAAGIPAPVIEWQKNGKMINGSSPENPYEKLIEMPSSDATLNSILKITVKEQATYTCVALNYPIVGLKVDRIHVPVVPIYPMNNPMKNRSQAIKLQDDEGRSQDVCAPYRGSFCQAYLQGRTVHHGHLDTDTGLGDKEAVIAGLWKEVDDSGLFRSYFAHVRDGFCQDPAKRLLCHVAFPDCDTDTGQPLAICRESCLAVKSLFCFRPWAEVDEMKLHGKTFKNKGNLSLPDCLSLPSKGNNSQSCIDSDHHNFSPAKVSDTCYTERGRWYNGTVNMTVSGRVCQAWRVNYPQQHDRSPQIFPELVGAENSCRNPGAEEEQPWCYTTDKHVRWEKCRVMPCGIPTTLNDPEEKTREEKEEEIDVFIIIIAAICVACVIVLIAVPLIIYRRCTRLNYRSTPQDDAEIDISNIPVNSAYHQVKSNRLNPKLETLEFPRNDIEYIRDLGQGAFGRVFQARLVCSNGNSHITGGKLSLSGSKYNLTCDKQFNKHAKAVSTSKADLAALPNDCNSSLLNPQFTSPVGEEGEDYNLDERTGQLIAVKMLKEDAAEGVQADFEREASLMVNFDHPNIVRLLGVCTVGKPMCLLFEFMSKGDLNEFLRQCSFDQCLVPSKNNSLPRVVNRTKLDLADQLSMARQIASGMSYLSDRGYVHRDLATRNCLVGCGLIVKIADFGLARSVHSMNYYHGSDKDAIPIRWMPPEAILYNKFSSQSDVWSFGVLLWEIFSYALQPYYGMTHEEVINYLCENKTLQCPDNTPPAVYDLMKSCWKRKLKQRPNFLSLHRALTVMCEDKTNSTSSQIV